MVKAMDYIGEYIYQNDTLGQILTAEGRIVDPFDEGFTQYHEYHYFLKVGAKGRSRLGGNHLGNTRITVGEPVTTDFVATMESENATLEEPLFNNVASTRHTDLNFNHTSGGNESAMLNHAQGRTYGPAISLEVHRGDTVKMEVFAKYDDPGSSYDGATGLSSLLASALFNPLFIPDAPSQAAAIDEAILAGAGIGSGGTDNVPLAYLNYLLFDMNHNPVDPGSGGFGYTQISGSCNGLGADHDRLYLEVTIDQPGYLYIYTTNETLSDVNVFFDDLKVTHIEPRPIVQSDDYYPFGGTLAGTSYQRLGAQKNKFKYNGKELQDDLDLNWYDYGARMYDPILGRWGVIDPNADRYVDYSPYNYVYNNPINALDPDGRDGILIVFPDYEITYKGKKYKNIGHAGVLLIDNKSGYTRYYEYGRYDSDYGEVRNYSVSNVKMGPDGKPTSKSLARVLKQISDESGHKGRIEGAYVTSDDFEAMKEFSESLLGQNNDPNREGYDIFNNNCGTFACDVLDQDAKVKKDSPWILDPRPNSIIEEYQDVFDGVSYDPETGSVKYSVNKKYWQQILDYLNNQNKEQEKEKDEEND